MGSNILICFRASSSASLNGKRVWVLIINCFVT